MTDQIEFQGLRKSGQMHKVRLSQNNYQLVAQSAGQSPEVLMSNYNEALESEKRTLSLLVETNFYPGGATPPAAPTQAPLQAGAVGALLEQVQQDPALSRQILQLLLSNALNIAWRKDFLISRFISWLILLAEDVPKKNPSNQLKTIADPRDFSGAVNAIRTHDLILTKDVLCRLSYNSIWRPG